jgi:membrane-bound ClpP family serine protease
MRPPPINTKLKQATGVFVLSIATGLVVYQSPPDSWDQLSQWVWQPALTGIMNALGVLGINAALRPTDT